MRGFIKKQQQTWFPLFVLIFLVGVSYGVVVFGLGADFSSDFIDPQFSRGGQVENEFDPSYSGDVIWNIQEKEIGGVNLETFFSASGAPNTNMGTARDGIKQYKVQKGETIKTIASKFSLSIETILAANPQIKKDVKRGDILIILPLNGILYDIKDGDTIDSVSTKYEISEELIKQFNSNFISLFSDGKGRIFLPYAKEKGDEIQKKDLKDVSQQISIPAQGWNWGELHKESAVDIANKCGTKVVAAADGVVVRDEVLGSGISGWNNGYGTFVLIEHANGVKTRYAHLEDVSVDIGDVVSRGQIVGVMGQTGNTETVRGCHVHFEVLGAKNPFVTR